MKVTVEDATLAHVLPVLDDIRPADLREWYAGTGMAFDKAVAITLGEEGYRKVALLDGVALCFWGMNEEGSIWLFATETGEANSLPLHRVLRPELTKMLAIHPRLTALADCRNEVHHKWLSWLGFELEEEVTAGPFGLPFRLYSKEATPCA